MKTHLTELSILLLLLVAACAPVASVELPAQGAVPAEPAEEQSATEEATKQGGIISRAITTEPSGLDPHGTPGSGQNILLPYIFDTLVYRDAGNNYHPFLAESWEVSDDGTAITFKLREDVSFHDGAPMDADAVVFTFERFMDLGSKSPVAGGLKDIAAVQALDDYTVQFTFEEPSAVFFGTISMPFAGIVSPTAVAEAGDTWPQQPVGTGPFMMADWDPGVAITLDRNPDYRWGPLDVENKAAPSIDQAVFKVIPDASTQLAAFQAGEADVVFVNQPAHLAKLEGIEGTQLTEAAINAVIYLGFNAGSAPFDDVLVRQALSHAVQKDDILQAVLGGVGKVSCTPLASTLPGYDESLCEYELGYDPVQAEELLAEAGYAKNDDGNWEKGGELLAATILTSTRAPNGDIAAMLQSQFGAIGIPIDILQLDARAAMGAATAGDYDMMVWRYGWNDADVLNIYLASERIGSTNRSHYSNPDVDELLAQAIHELDADARAQLYQQAIKLIMADAPWQPLYEPLDVIAVSGHAQDVVIGPMGRVLLNDAWVAE